MIVMEQEQEYSGVLDWIKEKFGVDYVKLKEYKNLEELREDTSKLKRENIPYKIKCTEKACLLLVPQSRVKEASGIIGASIASGGSSANPWLLGLVIAAPILFLFMNNGNKEVNVRIPK